MGMIIYPRLPGNFIGNTPTRFKEMASVLSKKNEGLVK